MLRGYQRKTKPANWLSVPGAQPVRGPAKETPEQKRRRELDKLARGLRKVRPSQAAKHVAKPGKKSAEYQLYRKEAREFVAAAVARGERCPVVASVPELRDGRKCGHRISSKLVEVHHRRGRLGPLLRDQRHWMPISKQGHRWVHANIEEARKRGWIANLGEWNKPDLT